MLPTSIRILGRPFQIVMCSESEMDGASGICVVGEGCIYILKDMHLTETLDTLIHELMHALYYLFGINAEGELEETVVRRLATGMTSIFMDNPSLTKYINFVRKENK